MSHNKERDPNDVFVRSKFVWLLQQLVGCHTFLIQLLIETLVLTKRCEKLRIPYEDKSVLFKFVLILKFNLIRLL